MIFEVKANTTPRYRATFVDEDDVAIASSVLTTLTLTLLNVRTRAVINGRDRQNVLNLNNVTISAAGVLTWTIQALDLPTTVEDVYQAIFEWTWATGTKSGWHDLSLRVYAVPRP